MNALYAEVFLEIMQKKREYFSIYYSCSMRDKTVPLTVPATPKKVATPTSPTAAASPLQATVTQEESESEEEDDNIKPRGKVHTYYTGVKKGRPAAKTSGSCNQFCRQLLQRKSKEFHRHGKI